jgi:hypothetical protein
MLFNSGMSNGLPIIFGKNRNREKTNEQQSDE